MFHGLTGSYVRRIRRVSLRFLLLSVLLIGIWFGWIANRAHEQKNAVDAIERLGGKVWFDGRDKGIPPWIRSNLGDEFFKTAIGVDVSFLQLKESDLDAVVVLKSLRSLSLAGTPISDTGLSRLAGLGKLETLDLGHCHITDRGLCASEVEGPEKLEPAKD